MKAVVFHNIGDIRLDDVPEPRMEQPTDAIVRLTASAICGTDLHFIRGTFPGMKSGTVLGHEGVGVVEQVGESVRNIAVGDQVVIPSTIACGYCSYCREGYYAQCDNANPNGLSAGTAFYGGPALAGGFNGLQAEKARIPFPIGMAMNKNLTIKMGNCNHRKYIPHLIELIRTGGFDPTSIITQREPLVSAIDAYKAFDTRQPGWLKVELLPQDAGNRVP